MIACRVGSGLAQSLRTVHWPMISDDLTLMVVTLKSYIADTLLSDWGRSHTVR